MSQITIYTSTGLSLEKHWIIENIENYIQDKQELPTITDFQYIKHQLHLSIKINMTQLRLLNIPQVDYDYMKISNTGSDVKYYFIVNKIWRSENTIEFVLVMDVLNTYAWNSDYEIDKKTLVTREHKDRVKVIDPSFPSYLRRLVDLKSENIYPQLYKDFDEKVLPDDNSDLSWILYYRNKDPISDTDYEGKLANNPVECFLAPSRPIRARYSLNNATINASDFPNNGYYYIQCIVQFSINGVNYPINLDRYLEIQKTSSGLNIKMCDVVEKFQQPDEWYDEFEKETIATNIASFDVIEPNVTQLNFKFFTSPISDPYTQGYISTPIQLSNTTLTFILDANNIVRTDSRNIKIIEIPYAPTNITYDEDNDIYIFDAPWQYDVTQKLFKLISLDTKFMSEFETTMNPLANTTITNDMYDTPTPNDERNDLFESKIYHSDFYQPKMVYDSFSLLFQYELLGDNFDPSVDGKFKIDFIMSRNVISKFLFKFPQYTPKYGVNDFDNIIAVSRNNEQVIYNSSYLNYIRNGYNFDLKAKQRNQDLGQTTNDLSTLLSLMGIALGVASGTGFGSVLAATSGMTSIAIQSINYAKSVAQADQNLQEKLNQVKMQSVSILNADDIDLLNAYCENKLKYCVYQVSPTMKQALLDMFYYSGYATQEHKIPNVETRYWFNYLQADLVIKTTNNLSDEIINQIKDLFKDGCTFFHEHSGVYDTKQEKENYEIWMLE